MAFNAARDKISEQLYLSPLNLKLKRTNKCKKVAFIASFDSEKTFLEFMVDRFKKKGFDGNDGDKWTKTYINSWWSPAEKRSYTKGTVKYNQKLAIFDTAIRKWNSLP